MKIDKVVFSASETFSVFWNLQSRIWKTRLNIEPVCLFFGDRNKVDLSEQFGQVIEMPIDSHYPLLIQITWSKFWWPTTEPDATWLIGDIDLIPLAARWFTDNIASVPDDHYVHLDADGITQLAGTASWMNGVVADLGCPTNLPGHYHCGNGRVLDAGLERGASLSDELCHIVHSGLYQNTRGFREDDPIEQRNLWCAEELRSTRAIRRQIEAGKIKLTPFSLRHGIDRIDGDRLDKCRYIGGKYDCDEDRLRAGGYADLHCARPFPHYLDEDECKRRMRATENTLTIAGML